MTDSSRTSIILSEISYCCPIPHTSKSNSYQHFRLKEIPSIYDCETVLSTTSFLRFGSNKQSRGFFSEKVIHAVIHTTEQTSRP